VYFGNIGEDSQVVREYFARHGAHCPPNMNPAEYMLEAIGAGVTPMVGNRDWKDLWLESPEYQTVLDEIKSIKEEALSRPEPNKKTMSTCLYPGVPSLLASLTDIIRRCYTVPVPAPAGGATEQLGAMAITRLYLQSHVCVFIHLPLHLFVLLAAWQ